MSSFIGPDNLDNLRKLVEKQLQLRKDINPRKILTDEVEFMPKFSVRGTWQRWRESYPEDWAKHDDAIIVFTRCDTFINSEILESYPEDWANLDVCVDHRLYCCMPCNNGKRSQDIDY
ncbi:hypothetical protein CTI12_AA358510 [Artemisia annua]|uniref:Uncharacterized protein n=1 Tax=Artemisia annua TaxID=35608 RepID=A0A2U1MJS6_ARTAN|nr:hypothetical protein CTI12_AA358510 [Artemisia annua]